MIRLFMVRSKMDIKLIDIYYSYITQERTGAFYGIMWLQNVTIAMLTSC